MVRFEDDSKTKNRRRRSAGLRTLTSRVTNAAPCIPMHIDWSMTARPLNRADRCLIAADSPGPSLIHALRETARPVDRRPFEQQRPKLGGTTAPAPSVRILRERVMISPAPRQL